MISFPSAKINLGLNIIEQRADGYHNLQTVFYPIPLRDRLEVNRLKKRSTDCQTLSLSITGISVECDKEKNIVVKAYNLVRQLYPKECPADWGLTVKLHKEIPAQAGMGGGSSDGAYMLRMLNDLFSLRLSNGQLADIAARLGADCPFFIYDRPCYAEGTGNKLTPISVAIHDMWIVIVKPPIAVSTREAYSLITPRRRTENCLDIVTQPVETWRGRLFNDFEECVFNLYPIIGQIKRQLYSLGAVFALMTGSGSSVFAFFREKPTIAGEMFADCFVWIHRLI